MITELNQIEQLGDIREVWDQLLSLTPQATFFQSLEWLEVYWKHYGAKQQLKVLTVQHGGEIVGIVPLVVRKERTKIGTLRYLTYPLDYWGSFYSALGADPHAILAEGLEFLRKSRRDWDLIDLRWLGVTPTDCQQTADLLTATGETPVCHLLDQTAVIQMPENWEAYLASRTGKWRNNLKRWQRKADELGEVTYLRYRPEGDPRWDLFDQCVAVAEASWQGDSSDGTTISHESIQPFIRDCHEAAAARGCVDLNLMYLNQKPVAFGYNYCYQGRVFGMRVGYDPAVKSCSAGSLMYAHMISDACHRGDDYFDLGPGSLDCKRQVWTDVLPIYRLTCYRKYSLPQQLMRIKRQRDASKQLPAASDDDKSETSSDTRSSNRLEVAPR